jgi:cell division protein FtsB
LVGATTTSRETKPPLLTRTIAWVTGALCGLLILACIGEAWTVHRLNQQIAASQQSVNQLQTQNEMLKKLIQTLQQPGTIEEEARKLGFIFPGDQPVVIVIASSPPAPTTTPAPPSSSNFWGFWPDWLKFFFGG